MQLRLIHKIFILSRLVAIIFLLIAFTNQSSVFYTILQIIVCCVGVYSAYVAFKSKQMIWNWLMISISVLFNPIFQIHFERNQWLVIDALTILVLLYSIPNILLTKEIKEPKVNFRNPDINYNYREPVIDYKFKKAINIIIIGILLIVGGLLVWGRNGNQFDELKLIQNPKIATGTLESIENYEDEDDRGNVHVIEVGKYSFISSDGQKYFAYSRKYLVNTILVEYLSDNPKINRGKGEGSQNIIEWFLSHFYMLALFTFPGFYLTYKGIKDFRLEKKRTRVTV